MLGDGHGTISFSMLLSNSLKCEPNFQVTFCQHLSLTQNLCFPEKANKSNKEIIRLNKKESGDVAINASMLLTSLSADFEI